MESHMSKKQEIVDTLRKDVEESIDNEFKFDPSERPLMEIGTDLFVFTQKTIDQDLLDTKIDLFINDQARLFWYHKGCPIQDKNGELDDHYNAKRYVMFLIADKLIYNCRNQSRCPFEVILKSDKLAVYLQSLSVKEFLLTKAYLQHKNRIEKKEATVNSRHYEDYYFAEKYLQGAATGLHCKCKHFNNIQPIVYWDKIISTGWPSSLVDIKNAKTRSLVRLHINDHQKYKDTVDFVENFYDKISPIIENRQIPEITLVQLVKYFYSNKTIVNMFEFFLRCFLVSRIEKESFTLINRENSSHSNRVE